jgi:hypothetical protein
VKDIEKVPDTILFIASHPLEISVEQPVNALVAQTIVILRKMESNMGFKQCHECCLSSKGEAWCL